MPKPRPGQGRTCTCFCAVGWRLLFFLRRDSPKLSRGWRSPPRSQRARAQDSHPSERTWVLRGIGLNAYSLETGSLGQLGGSGFEAGRNRGYSLGFRLCWSAEGLSLSAQGIWWMCCNAQLYCTWLDGWKPELEAATTDSGAHCDCSVFW